jgi:2-hydroxychromene-2-carboxylate isomerase
MQHVDVYIGLGSRYSYLAFTQLARLEESCACSFALHPISSVELMALRGVSPFDGTPLSGQYDWAYRRRDAEYWAAFYGVPFLEPQRLPCDHRLMARACHAAALQDNLQRYCAALFRAVFVEHRRIDVACCVALATGLGLDAEQFAQDMESARIDHRVTQTAIEAHRRGAFGVPTFFVDDAMFWGNDRLPLVERRLRRELSIERVQAERSALDASSRIPTDG